MPTGRGWAATGVATALLFLWVGFGEIELMTTAMFLLAAVAVGTIFVRINAPEVLVARRLIPTQVHAGDTVTVELELVPFVGRKLRNVAIVDAVHGLGLARFAAGSLSPLQPVVARYEVECSRRGSYEVGPAEVTVSDAFGLSERRRRIGTSDRLVVYPVVEKLIGLPRMHGMEASRHRNRPVFSPTGSHDFYTLREYQVGDDLRKVHWPSSARRDTLMIRQFEIHPQEKALVVLDPRLGIDPEAFEQAVIGAASVVTHLFCAGFTTDLAIGSVVASAPNGEGYRQAMELLARAKPTHDSDPTRGLMRLRRQHGGGGILLMVTARLDDHALSTYRALAPGFGRWIVLSADEADQQLLATLVNLGALPVVAPPGRPWAPPWTRAMELSWSTA